MPQPSAICSIVLFLPVGRWRHWEIYCGLLLHWLSLCWFKWLICELQPGFKRRRWVSIRQAWLLIPLMDMQTEGIDSSFMLCRSLFPFSKPPQNGRHRAPHYSHQSSTVWRCYGEAGERGRVVFKREEGLTHHGHVFGSYIRSSLISDCVFWICFVFLEKIKCGGHFIKLKRKLWIVTAQTTRLKDERKAKQQPDWRKQEIARTWAVTLSNTSSSTCGGMLTPRTTLGLPLPRQLFLNAWWGLSQSFTCLTVLAEKCFYFLGSSCVFATMPFVTRTK